MKILGRCDTESTLDRKLAKVIGAGCYRDRVTRPRTSPSAASLDETLASGGGSRGDPLGEVSLERGDLVGRYLVLEAIGRGADRKSTRLNSSHVKISYAVFCLKKKIDCANALS